MAPASRQVGGWLAAAVFCRRVSRRCVHGDCCGKCTRAAPNRSTPSGATAWPLHGCCCRTGRRPRKPPAWFRHAGAGRVSDAAKKRARGDAGRSLAQRHVRRTSHLIVKLDERELVRRTRPAARQGCTLGRGAARRFHWADIDQVDNKRASCERPRYSHGPAAAWESLAKPWGLSTARLPLGCMPR